MKLICFFLLQERAEVRTARVSLVFGLMSMLPRKTYRNFIKWLLKLTTTAKVVHRQIGMVIILSFIQIMQLFILLQN